MLHLLTKGDLSNISGGYIYNRELVSALSNCGFSVTVHDIGSTPAMQQTLAELNVGSCVIVDSIIADDFARAYDPALNSLYVVYLCHLPLGLRPALTRECRESQASTPLSPRAAPLNRALSGAEGQRSKSTLEYKILKQAQLVICTSEFTRDWLVRLNNKTQYLVTLPNVSPAFTPPEPINQHQDGTIHLLCVANILPAKGQLAVLETLCALPDQSWHLHLIAGSAICDEEYLAQIHATIRTNNAEHQVSLKFDYAGSKLVREYQQADVFVLATQFETYGMALAEARACALPTIVCDVGGVRESTYAPATLYITPNSAQELRHALQRCITERTYLPALRNAALTGLQQKQCIDTPGKDTPGSYDWDNGVKRLCEALAC